MSTDIKAITPATVTLIWRNLKDSYPDVTREYVNAEVEKIKAGEAPKDIIGMFAKGMLTDAGYLTEDGKLTTDI